MERNEGPQHEFVRLIATVQDALRAYDSAMRNALAQFREAERSIRSQVAEFEALWGDPSEWVANIAHATDLQTIELSNRLARAGWWFFPLLHFLPYAELSRLDDLAQEEGDDELNRNILRLFRLLLADESLVGGESLTHVVEDALLFVDPTGGELRGRYFRQARRAFKLGGMHALVPPAMFGQADSLIAVASYRGILGSDPYAYWQIFNDPEKARRLTKSFKRSYTPSLVRARNTELILPLAFVHQFDVLDALFGKLTRSVGVGDYASAEEIEDRASGLPSRHYVVHGGPGVDTDVHAARAMTFFIGTALILRDVQRLGALVDSHLGP